MFLANGDFVDGDFASFCKENKDVSICRKHLPIAHLLKREEFEMSSLMNEDENIKKKAVNKS